MTNKPFATGDVNQFIRNNWQKMTDMEMAQAITAAGFPISAGAVAERRKSMKIKKSRSGVRKPPPGVLKAPSGEEVDSDSVNRFIRENYLTMTDVKMAEAMVAAGFAINAGAISERRKSMGLQKNGAVKTETPSSSEEGEASPEEQTAADGKILQLQDELAKLRKLYKVKLREDSSQKALEDAIREVVPTRDPVRTPRPIKVSGDEKEVETAVLCLGDLHIGEVVDEDETGGIAVYNLDIARRRTLFTTETAIRIVKNKLRGGYYIPKIEVFGLGDFVSGIIHKELEVTNEVGIIDQIVTAAEILAEVLLLLCQHFESVTFTGVVGNHGRVEMHKYFKMKAKNNYDRLVYVMVEKVLANQPNLTMNIPVSFWTIREVEGKRFLLMHGDQVKSWMGFPFYGLNRGYLKLRALLESYGQGFDTMIVGHFHNPNIFTVGRDQVIVNGSTKGGDEFALGAISAACDPVQILFGVHPRKGRTWTFDLNSASVR